MSSFRDAMRRVITGDNAQGKSVVIIDGGPSSDFRLQGFSGLGSEPCNFDLRFA